MKRNESPWKRYILPVLLLAAACVGAVELWVCSIRAPDVFAAVTSPVRAAVLWAGKTGDQVWTALRQRTDEAVEDGVSQVKAGLQRLDEYLSRRPEPDQLPEEPEPDTEVQFLDDAAVTPPPRDRAEYYITALASRNGSEYLTGGSCDLVYYDQTDSAWAEKPYGSDTIGRYGCGPVAMAMVVSSLSETGMDPAQMAEYCADHGHWARKHGSYWSIVPGVSEDFGLTCISLPPEETDVDAILQYLATGHLLVAMMGPGHFTNGGHFIVLRGGTLDGSVLVADPASPNRSLVTWDPELILEELSPNRSSGGPLWAISAVPSL